MSIPKAQVTESSSGEVSCSIEETNRVRALLGLRPLDVGKKNDKEEAMAKEHEERLQREARKAEQAEVAARIASVRNKRLLHAKMRGKSLGQQLMEDGPSSAAEWVKSMKAAQKKKKTREERLAARTAAALQEQDEAAMTADWGGSAGKRANTASSSASAYTSKDLQGLKLAHSAKSFREGQQVILTLADTSVLDDDAEQELVNVNMAEDDKRTENTRKARKLAQLASRGGNALDDEEFGPDAAPSHHAGKKKLLAKYDIDDDEAARKAREALVLGAGGVVAEGGAEEYNDSMVDADGEVAFNLDTTKKAAAEYYTKDEMSKFMKPKKKKSKKSRKLRKKRKHKEREEEEEEAAAAAAEEGSGGAAVDDEVAELKSGRRRRKKKRLADELKALGDAEAGGDGEQDHGSRNRRGASGGAVEARKEAADKRRAYKSAIKKASAKAKALGEEDAAAAAAITEAAAMPTSRQVLRQMRQEGVNVVAGAGAGAGAGADDDIDMDGAEDGGVGTVNQFSGHRVYNFSASEEAEESVIDDDAELVASLARARRLAKKQMKKEKDGSNLGAAERVEAAMKALDATRAQRRGPESKARKAKGLTFTSTTEFSNSIKARMREQREHSAEEAARLASRKDGGKEEGAGAGGEQDGAGEGGDGEGAAAGGGGGDSGTSIRKEDEGGVASFMAMPLAAKGMAATLALLKQSGTLAAPEQYSGRAKDAKPDANIDKVAPNIKLEYRDEFGYKMTPKEAYRFMSYKFHGHKPGKKATEKRLRRVLEMSQHKIKGGGKMLKQLKKSQKRKGQAFMRVDM